MGRNGTAYRASILLVERDRSIRDWDYVSTAVVAVGV